MRSNSFKLFHAIKLTPFWNLHVCLCNRFVCGLVQLKHFVWLVSHKGPSAFGPIIAFVSSLTALGNSVVPVNKLKVTWTVGCTFQFICIISIYMDINLMNSTWINGYLYSFARGLCCGASSQLTAGKVWWLHVYMSRNDTSVWDFCVAWSLTMADRKVQTLSRSPTRLVETRYQDTHLLCRFWRKRKLQTKQSSTIMSVQQLYSNSLGRIKPKYLSWNYFLLCWRQGLSRPAVDSLQSHFLSLFLSNIWPQK